ncbi:GNAT family N-acetyltransferase [Acetivibrio clariflavus]|uniref:Acetyltransferase n=1 Tax=Acetivibrio clariflavus (strain DSM 19732 / NBRC 101661 / EBR45) TaxID=720554 RepID=G8LV74_ACECE|nr:GNAT family N-acetyltransferase [Acetivibrio clariflavus]AEV67428.1 acetyltransferase [Acetivibrio clariflavus DSM 19732]
MQLRQANKTDVSQLINMRLAYLAEDYDGLTEEQTDTIRVQLLDYFGKHLNRDLFVYVCEDNAVIVSTVFLLISEKPANPSFLTGLTGTIMNVYTLPHYRKRGIAGNLIRMAIQDAKSKKLSYIDLKATQAASSLYRKLGFAPDESKYLSMRYYINID